MSTTSVYRLGFDIGGTFTDLVLWHAETGDISIHKVLTTPESPADGVLKGLTELLSANEVEGSQIALAIHGTTLITNALIERKGAKTALLTTKGHRDVLEIGTEIRYDTYNLRMERPAPLVPRDLRFEIDERISALGEVLRAPDPAEIEDVLDQIEEAGCESIAVVFLHSFKNPQHERLVRDRIRERFPDKTVSASADLAPVIREYQRTSTTVANAYVQPITARYMKNMKEGVKKAGYDRQVYLMLSHGGISTAEAGAESPIYLLESGPAAGALATAYIGRQLGEDTLLSFDMGGTTAKVCLIDDGVPTITDEFEAGRVQRFKAGSGLPIHVPVINMIEIGAGGGSIGRADRMGLLKVGPDSAGSNPGPVSYGLGGTEPTVTDANVALGYLNPEYFLGGRMSLDTDGAQRALEERVAKPLGLSVVDAAWGIHSVVNENMMSALKVHVAERGRDPRKYTMVAFGGAGPVHAQALAKGLKLQKVIYPAAAGVLSALGFLSAPMSFDFARSVMTATDAESLGQLESLFQELQEEGKARLIEAGVDPASVVFERTADMRYFGQNREINVDLGTDALGASATDAVLGRFTEHYEALYGHAHPEVPVQVVTIHLTAKGPDPDLRLRQMPLGDADAGTAQKGTRPVYFPELGDFKDVPVYDRYALTAGMRLSGPAIIEERESTAVIGPDMEVEIDTYLNVVAHL